LRAARKGAGADFIQENRIRFVKNEGHPSRPEAALIVKYNEFARAAEFRVQRQRHALAVTANNNEHQCRLPMGWPSWPPWRCPACALTKKPTPGQPEIGAQFVSFNFTNELNRDGSSSLCVARRFCNEIMVGGARVAFTERCVLLPQARHE
jgi:hypothetical protein